MCNRRTWGLPGRGTANWHHLSLSLSLTLFLSPSRPPTWTTQPHVTAQS